MLEMSSTYIMQTLSLLTICLLFCGCSSINDGDDSVSSSMENPVTIHLIVNGKAVPGYPKCAVENNSFPALYSHAKASEVLPKAKQVDANRWDQTLEASETYVVGWITKDRMFGYLSDPFVAADNLDVTLSPGLPASFEYDVSGLPKNMWPEKVHLLKSYYQNGKLTYLNCGLIGKIKNSGKGSIANVAQGEYQISALTRNYTSVYPEPILSVRRNVTIKAGTENTFVATMPEIDMSVDAGDITIKGKLINDSGQGSEGQSVYLIPFGHSPEEMVQLQFCYYYPKKTTSSEGEFQFDGVNPSFIYQIEHWKSGKRISCHSMRPSDFTDKEHIEIVMQEGKTTVENPFCPVPSQPTNKSLERDVVPPPLN